MKQFKTVTDLQSFSRKHHTTIADIFIEGIEEHKGEKGVVTFELNETDELVGLGYNVIDRRKLKAINLSGSEKKDKKTVLIYWEILKEGIRINAAKQFFVLPLSGIYYSMK